MQAHVEEFIKHFPYVLERHIMYGDYEIVTWCEDHFGPDGVVYSNQLTFFELADQNYLTCRPGSCWTYLMCRVYFKYETDAILFKLRWM